ncbi:putative cold shock protein [Nocardia nova SH22a]|uniref:Putative cold shock protein n=1 Tax=Nocardia nova SH22a TaxID=1415166 RepID=W5TNE4_9NOCA|nr:cold shock domain-containing protein [Nocardia nova]AHH20669.1 putative cold shock protein [Nocardia nova SH22a]
MAIGTVKFFRSDKGWGAVSCSELPDGRDAWVHYSAIEGDGFRELVEGERVEFEYEAAEQDSFRFRATRVRRIDAE